MRDIVVLGGSSHPELTRAICDRLALQPGQVKQSKFSNGETNVEIFQSVRDMNVFIVQSGCGAVNDHLMELLIMVSACKIASARKVTVVLPLFPYARQPDSPYKRNGMPLNRLSPEACAKLADMQGQSFPHEPCTSSPTSRSPSPTKDSNAEGNDASDQAGASTPPPQQQQHPSIVVPHPTSETNGNARMLTAAAAALRLNGASLPAHLATQNHHHLHHYLPHHSRSASPAPSVSSTTTKAGYKVWTAKPGTLIADMLVAAGAQHIITMDMHHPQFQGFFDIPVDNLLSYPLMYKYIVEKIPDWRDSVIVSPDAGGAKRATAIANALNVSFALIHKDRRHSTASLTLVGSVKDKVAIIVDDIADTCHTLARAAHVLESNGAKKVYALVTHGIMSGDAPQRLARAPIDQLIVSNSVPQADNLEAVRGAVAAQGRDTPRVKVFDIAPIFAEAIRRIHNGESVSFLFDIVPIVH